MKKSTYSEKRGGVEIEVPARAGVGDPIAARGLPIDRRAAVGTLAAIGAVVLAPRVWAAVPSSSFRLAAFRTDVTPPLGHPLLADLAPRASAVDDPLAACGFVLLSADAPIVFVSVDWLEIRNDAYDRWREVLAEAAATTADRVLVSCIHQHDAPLADLEAERLLRAAGSSASICDPVFHERAVQQVAQALRNALGNTQEVTHLGMGRARVERLASNRRYLDAGGMPRFDRTSATTDAYAAAQPDGTIDPWLKTLSFCAGETPVAALSVYATHPQSFYRTGRVSCDFPGLARNRLQAEDERVVQVYASGASGNVTVGKYNDGSPENRPRLADRLYQAMRAARNESRFVPLEAMRFRSAALRLAPRESPGFTSSDLGEALRTGDARTQSLAALGLSWRGRADAGRHLDVPAVDFGPAVLVLLPAESYVEYQLLAQTMRPDAFVVTVGYGECAPGYIPIDKAWEENDANLHTWCWVAPGAEASMAAAIGEALGAAPNGEARTR